MNTRLLALAALLLLTPARSALAAPPAWESDFGDEITGLTGEDDDEEKVTLSFPFPYEGTTYTEVWVGTNGGIQLGDLGTDGHIDYDNAASLAQFLDDGGYPFISPFNTDIDLDTTGKVHFKDFGNRAVFTWNEVGTNEEEEHLSTFQVQIFANGTIYFSYNGILDGEDEDLIDSLDQGIVVGISGSTGTDPGTVDLTNPQSTDTDTIYEVWKHTNDPTNALFDLDMQTLVFKPKAGGGFTSKLLVLDTTALPDLLIGKKPGALKGDGIRNAKKASAKQTVKYTRGVFQTNTSTVYLALQNDGGSAAPCRLRTFGDTLPRMRVTATAGGNNISAALLAGRYAPVVPAGGSVSVTYQLRTERFFAGVSRGGDRDDTIGFRLTSGDKADNAAMVNVYK